MSRRIVVTGTDTGIGKTVFAAGLADRLGACYWKPIQSGLEDETDSETVARLGGLSSDRILPERYRLTTPVSPHQSAAIDGVNIDIAALAVPDTGNRPLVIEGAGGLMVPLDQELPLYRRVCAMALSGRAVCADLAWHHQSFAVVAGGLAPPRYRRSRRGLHR